MRAIAWVEVLHDTSRRVALGHGDLIGRLPGAALSLDDGRISEAHALVSLRGGELHLLGLRGRFRVHQQVVSSVALVEGLEIELAEGLFVRVQRLVLPDKVLSIALPGQMPSTLTGTTSVRGGTTPALLPGYQLDALALIWAFGSSWRISIAGGPPAPLLPGRVPLSGDITLAVHEVALSSASLTRTRPDLVAPWRLHVFPAGVTLQEVGGPQARLGGLVGRTLGVLATAGRPLDWKELAARIWVDDRSDERSLRRRLDTTLSRLRRALRDAGLGFDRITLDGSGTASLTLGPDDRVEVVDDASHPHASSFLASDDADG
jgi:hypothetical protein